MGLHTRISAALAAVVVGVTHVLGGWTPAMTTLVTIVVLDMVSGFSRAAIQQRLSSKESWAGIGKKVMMFVVICLAAQVDRLLDANNVIRNATVIFYCVSESLSVLENVVAAGMPVPDVIRDALAQLLERKGKPPKE
jgi:toxin secretion/phage lysis holin